jgi:hypothetical protein
MKQPSVFLAIFLVFSACQATEPAGRLASKKSLTRDSKKIHETQAGHDALNDKSAGLFTGCFRITSADTDVGNQDMAQIAKDTYRICISEIISSENKDKIIVDLKASSDKTLRSFRFKEAMLARCPGCYIFTDSKDGSATFSGTAVATTSRLNVNLKQYDGALKFMMLRELRDAETIKSEN